MLFLVVSQPLPTRPSEVAGNRRRYWDWIQPLVDGGEVRQVYGRVGRGAVAILDVASNERLHALLNQWADIVPAEFQVYPLLDPEAMQAFLRTQD
jgi:hypothetical protein